MKKFFFLMLLLIPVLGGSLSAEKVLALTRSTGVWGEYAALLAQWLGNDIVDELAETDQSTDTNDTVPAFKSLSKGIPSSEFSTFPFYGGKINRSYAAEFNYGIPPLRSIPLVSQQQFTGPDPSTGFRIFMEVVERSV